MPSKRSLIKELCALAKPHRVTQGKGFRLADCDPCDTGRLTARDKRRATTLLQTGIQALAALQERLWAQDRWSLLVVLQAMDAAGKDGVIKHVFSGVNPNGCSVTSFKTPSSEELDHDFLWRVHRVTPERGRIGIFNRSYYEEVLVVKVHPEFLQRQMLPPEVVDEDLWDRRYQDIRAFERFLGRQGTCVRKIFLNVSADEQKRRFLQRLDDPEKHWKFQAQDVAERRHWDEYQDAYEQAIRETATEDAPWYVVPADAKWYTRIVVAAVIVEALESLDLEYPTLDAAQRRALEDARRDLLA